MVQVLQEDHHRNRPGIPRMIKPGTHITSALIAPRFWNKVEKSSGCWEWRSSKNIWGYGLFWLDGRYAVATHVSLWLDGQEVPVGMQACHHCDNPGCVRPNHLFVGTPQENRRDSMSKGRAHRGTPPRFVGEDHPGAKLNESQVVEIKKLLEQGLTCSAIAQRYPVSKDTIWAIKRGRLWKEVNP